MKTYSVMMESGLGPRSGKLQLSEGNGTVAGVLSILGCDNPVSGQWIAPCMMQLSHNVQTCMNTFFCKTTLCFHGNSFTGTMIMNQTAIELNGTLMTAEVSH